MSYEIPVLTQIAQVQRAIEKRPGCTSAEICDELGIAANVANTHAQRLRENGKVRRVKLPGSRAATWWPGREADFIERDKKSAGPSQRTVSEWKPCMVRDPLVDALFGRSSAAVAPE